MAKDSNKKTDVSKDKRIEEELNRLSIFFEELDENKKAIVSPLLQNAAFMKITLEDLQEKINEEGVVDIYQNGANQYGTKQSATLQSYNSLIKNYASVMKTLEQMLPVKKYKPAPFTWEPREKTPEEIEEERRREDEHRRKINEDIQRAAEEQQRRKAEWEARRMNA